MTTAIGGAILIVAMSYFGFTYHEWSWWMILLILVGLGAMWIDPGIKTIRRNESHIHYHGRDQQ